MNGGEKREVCQYIQKSSGTRPVNQDETTPSLNTRAVSVIVSPGTGGCPREVPDAISPGRKSRYVLKLIHGTWIIVCEKGWFPFMRYPRAGYIHDLPDAFILEIIGTYISISNMNACSIERPVYCINPIHRRGFSSLRIPDTPDIPTRRDSLPGPFPGIHEQSPNPGGRYTTAPAEKRVPRRRREG